MIWLIVEHLFRPYDLVRASERGDIQEKVHDVNATIEGLFEFWMDYYGRYYDKISWVMETDDNTGSRFLGEDDFLVKERKSPYAPRRY
jgi:hypothetical protein